MRFAIYARKSVYSDNSDSVDNQRQMCEDFIKLKYPKEIDSIDVYTDEGFTGADTERPNLKRMLSDIKDDLIDAVIVYQIDRLTRSVRDFSNLHELFKEYNIMLISIKEQFDTSTPIGNSQMYLMMIFAQMERQNIALRITDNLRGLARKGYWVGGNPPVGYVRKHIVVDGKEHCTIEPDPETTDYVLNIFKIFVEQKYSLTHMQTYFRKNGIRTPTGGIATNMHFYHILSSPYYVEATQEVYDHFNSLGCQIISPRECWDGSVGVMVYGRSSCSGKKHTRNKPDKWTVCLGIHKPFVPADLWLAAQKLFNTNKFDRTAKYEPTLLKGILRCSCGWLMSVRHHKYKSGITASWYSCTKRSEYGSDVCNRKMIKTEILDNKMLELLHDIHSDPAVIRNYISKEAHTVSGPSVKQIQSKITACESSIKKLTESLVIAGDTSATKHIIKALENKDLELQALQRDLSTANSISRRRAKTEADIDAKVAEISRFIDDFDNFTATEKNAILKDIVNECVWDGTTLTVTF